MEESVNFFKPQERKVFFFPLGLGWSVIPPNLKGGECNYPTIQYCS